MTFKRQRLNDKIIISESFANSDTFDVFKKYIIFKKPDENNITKSIDDIECKIPYKLYVRLPYEDIKLKNIDEIPDNLVYDEMCTVIKFFPKKANKNVNQESLGEFIKTVFTMKNMYDNNNSFVIWLHSKYPALFGVETCNDEILDKILNKVKKVSSVPLSDLTKNEIKRIYVNNFIKKSYKTIYNYYSDFENKIEPGEIFDYNVFINKIIEVNNELNFIPGLKRNDYNLNGGFICTISDKICELSYEKTIENDLIQYLCFCNKNGWNKTKIENLGYLITKVSGYPTHVSL